MVLFANIHLNQRVEVDFYGDILTGKVKYKGILNGLSGDWVGVAMDRGVGQHDGMLNGRRYFSCRPDHGIFTSANRIRFIPVSRGKFSSYRPISQRSEVDEALFTSYSGQMIDDEYPSKSVGWVSEDYLDRASDVFPNAGREVEPANYHLRHSISNAVSAPTQLRPTISKARFFYADEPCRHHYYRHWEEDDLSPQWISTPSIPKPHTAHSARTKQRAQRGYDRDQYVNRERTVHTYME